MKRSTIPLVAALCAALFALPACTTEYDFDPITVGDDDSGREPRDKANSQFVRSVYADLLGRTPEVFDFSVTVNGEPAFIVPIDEQELLVNTLDGVGDPTPMRALLTTGLVNSAEADIPAKSDVSDAREYIAEQFRRLLGRDPSVYELQTFHDEWQSDSAVTPATIIRALIGSREYQSF